MKATTLDQLRNCILGADAPFDADMTDCLDYVFDPEKRISKNPKLQRLFVEKLIEMAVEYGKRTTSAPRDKSKGTP